MMTEYQRDFVITGERDAKRDPIVRVNGRFVSPQGACKIVRNSEFGSYNWDNIGNGSQVLGAAILLEYLNSESEVRQLYGDFHYRIMAKGLGDNWTLTGPEMGSGEQWNSEPT